MSRKPFWVSEQEKSLMRTSHRRVVDGLQQKIAELEEENSDLKKKIAEMENVLMIAMGLLLKNTRSETVEKP